MSWTGQSDRELRCGEDPGPVGDAEEIAHLWHERNSLPFVEPFRIEALLPPTAFSNVCGASHGISVVRVAGRTDDEINDLAEAFAAAKGRQPNGAVVGEVSPLRAFRLPDLTDQVIFVYDDPVPDKEPMHAVVRFAEGIGRPAAKFARNFLKTVISRRVNPR